MPLYPSAKALLRTNLELAAAWFAAERTGRRKPPATRIGRLSDAQLSEINEHRLSEDVQPIIAEVLFDGRHLYQSRCLEDGYTIEEVIEMVKMTFVDTATVALGWSTVLRSATTHVNSVGATVRHELVFECTGKLPHPELLSVVPRGDGKDHTKKKKAAR